MSHNLWDSLLLQQETQEWMASPESLGLDSRNPEIQESIRPTKIPLGMGLLEQDSMDSIMPQKPTRRSYKSRNDQIWDCYKDDIRRFYIDEGNTLEATMCRIAGNKRKWKSKIKEWNFNKYLPATSMNIMIAKAEKRRREEGKETMFRHGDSLILSEKFDNFKKRKTTKVVAEILSPTAKTPPDISYYTPGPQTPTSVGTREYGHPTSEGSIRELVQANELGSIPEPGVDEAIALTARLRRTESIILQSIQLPFQVNGIETEADRVFLHHYISRLSIIFTLEGEHDSAFRNILLPMAQQHQRLMHSILALSSKHLDYSSPYGLQILREHPDINVQSLKERSQFHQNAAIKGLIMPQGTAEIAPTTYAQMMFLVLETLLDPSPSGQHRFHLQHYERMIQENPPEPVESMTFIHEFFQYHIHIEELTHFPQGEDMQYVSRSQDWKLPTTIIFPPAARLLGVFDGLFSYMSRITNIRNKIRQNIELGIDPIVDSRTFYIATEIDLHIKEWVPTWPTGDPRDVVGMLFKQMIWVYLWRTIYPPQTTDWDIEPAITRSVDNGLNLLAILGPRDPSQSLILVPVFIIGCAAFKEEQRDPIRRATSVVKSYRECKNVDMALEVLEEVWRLMDRKDERSWDWQSVAHRMGIDFLAV